LIKHESTLSIQSTYQNTIYETMESNQPRAHSWSISSLDEHTSRQHHHRFSRITNRTTNTITCSFPSPTCLFHGELQPWTPSARDLVRSPLGPNATLLPSPRPGRPASPPISPSKAAGFGYKEGESRRIWRRMRGREDRVLREREQQPSVV